MDLPLLKSKLLKLPAAYESEYFKILELYRTYTEVEDSECMNLGSVLDFLCYTSHLYNGDFVDLLFYHLENAGNMKNSVRIKEELMKSVFIMRAKKCITVQKFFEVVFEHKRKFRTVLKQCAKELEPSEALSELLYKYVECGNEKQQLFAANMIIRQFEITLDMHTQKKCIKRKIEKNEENGESRNEEVNFYTSKTPEMKTLESNSTDKHPVDTDNKIMDNLLTLKNILIDILLSEKKPRNVVLYYFLDLIDLQDSLEEEEEENFYKKIRKDKKKKKEPKKDEVPLEEKIKLKLTAFDKKINPPILEFIDKKEAKTICKKLFQIAKNTIGERDLKLKRLKLITILKNKFNLSLNIYPYIIRLIDPSVPDLNLVMNIFIESTGEKECIDAVKLVVKKFCSEYHDDDFIAYGLNLLRELCHRYPVKEEVTKYTEIYKLSKNKGIFYAYNLLQRVIKYGVCENREIDYVKKKRKKETEWE